MHLMAFSQGLCLCSWLIVNLPLFFPSLCSQISWQSGIQKLEICFQEVGRMWDSKSEDTSSSDRGLISGEGTGQNETQVCEKSQVVKHLNIVFITAAKGWDISQFGISVLEPWEYWNSVCILHYKLSCGTHLFSYFFLLSFSDTFPCERDFS